MYIYIYQPNITFSQHIIWVMIEEQHRCTNETALLITVKQIVQQQDLNTEVVQIIQQ